MCFLSFRDAKEVLNIYYMKAICAPITILLLLVLTQCSKVPPVAGYSDTSVPIWGPDGSPGSGSSNVQTVSAPTGTAQLLRSVNLKVDMVPKGTHGRKVYRHMNPRYITIHSTQNYSAGAERHSLALKRGALRAPKRRGGNRIGYLIWHFTVDDKLAIQHMPTYEQGEHADFDGPGNRYSIGIEMCEHRGSNLGVTIDRTARLTAYLMIKNNIPLNRVVPHYHWERKGTRIPHKNCPHFLMDNGKPGRKWKAFQKRVNQYYRQALAAQVASN